MYSEKLDLKKEYLAIVGLSPNSTAMYPSKMLLTERVVRLLGEKELFS